MHMQCDLVRDYVCTTLEQWLMPGSNQGKGGSLSCSGVGEGVGAPHVPGGVPTPLSMDWPQTPLPVVTPREALHAYMRPEGGWHPVFRTTGG